MSYESSVDGNGVDSRYNYNNTNYLKTPQKFDLANVYKMNHFKKGIFLIINNKSFESQTKMSERSGTDVDAKNLEKLFKSLGFIVIVKSNQTALQMAEVLQEVAKDDHSEYDCFGAAFLSHGEEGIIYGIDRCIQIETLINPIKLCLSLVGKPKIFFIQACRGDKLDHGVEMNLESDGDLIQQKIRIPLEADFLYAYSTVPGYYSWRNSTKGSWFIQALCQKMDEYRNQNIDLLTILTRVNHSVALEFESSASKSYMNRKKQISSIVSMLTKDLYITT